MCQETNKTRKTKGTSPQETTNITTRTEVSSITGTVTTSVSSSSSSLSTVSNTSTQTPNTTSKGGDNIEQQIRADDNIMTTPSQTRRRKRDKKPLDRPVSVGLSTATTTTRIKRKSKIAERHANDASSNGVHGAIMAMLPSVLGIAILVVGVMAKMGFRGRATVAGIDLGTTNSVICVQAPAKGIGEIQCISDPSTNSPIIPSVVSFLDASEKHTHHASNTNPKLTLSSSTKQIPSKLNPHPSHVVVGVEAKRRINSHPHHTLYNAKRVLGRSSSDPAIDELRSEVEFQIVNTADDQEENEDEEMLDEVGFVVPDFHRPILPQQVGSYVVHHLMQITKKFLGHDNIKSAVICVPAKFNDKQKQATYRAFQNAGVKVARVVEEPTAAALAYGLHRKQGVDYILVYDFGGGTLDISLLHVSEGFVDVMGSDGDDRLGGADFDAAVAHFLLEQRGGDAVVQRTAKILEHLTETLPDVDLEEELSSQCPVLNETPLCTSSSFHTLGEQMKIGLSAYPSHDGEVEAQCLAPPPQGDEAGAAMPTLDKFCSSLEPVTLKLTSQEYDTSVQSLYDRSIVPVQRLLTDLDLQVEDIDEVVMVGGTTRMPQIRTLVREALPASQLNTHIDPDITVAYGAASVID